MNDRRESAVGKALALPKVFSVGTCFGQVALPWSRRAQFHVPPALYLLLAVLAFCLIIPAAISAAPLELGDIVVVQQTSGRVYVVDPDNGRSRTVFEDEELGTALAGVAIDSKGRIITSTRSSLGVIRIDPADSGFEVLADGPLLARPGPLAFEDPQHLLVGDWQPGLIRVNVETSEQQQLTRYSGIQDIEVGNDGTIYLLDFGIVNSGGGRIVAVDPLTGGQEPLANDGRLFNPSDMSLSPIGDLIVSNRRNNTLSEILRIDRHSGQQEHLFSYGSGGFVTHEDTNYLLIGDSNNKKSCAPI